MRLVDTPLEHRPEDLLLGVLAALSISGTTTLRTTDKQFHLRFSKALEIFSSAPGKQARLAKFFHRDPVSKTYDQLDHALIAAEQMGWVKFPNPSFSRFQITMTPRDAERLLDEWAGDRSTIESAAKEILASL